MHWLPVVGYENYYEVSNAGEVRSLDRSTTGYDGRTISHKGQILKQTSEKRRGYKIVALSVKGQVKYKKVHRLVLEAFVGPCPENMESCHNDGSTSNNNLENLQWNTKSHNNLDRVRHKTHTFSAREKCKLGHLLQDPNLSRRSSTKSHWRGQCLACSRAHAQISSYKRRGCVIPDFDKLANEKYTKIMGDVLA